MYINLVSFNFSFHHSSLNLNLHSPQATSKNNPVIRLSCEEPSSARLKGLRRVGWQLRRTEVYETRPTSHERTDRRYPGERGLISFRASHLEPYIYLVDYDEEKSTVNRITEIEMRKNEETRTKKKKKYILCIKRISVLTIRQTKKKKRKNFYEEIL